MAPFDKFAGSEFGQRAIALAPEVGASRPQGCGTRMCRTIPVGKLQSYKKGPVRILFTTYMIYLKFSPVPN